MTNVVVTGANGFIGSHLVDHLLAAGNEVTCLVRAPERFTARQRQHVRLIRGDVRDAAAIGAAIQGADQVFHLAGLVKANRSEELFAVNEGGARNVAESCARQSTPPTLILTSSLAAAGPSHGDAPRCESDPEQPVSRYGRSKLAGEQAARDFAHVTPTTIVRPAVVFGGGDRNSFGIFRPISRFGLHAVPGRKPSLMSTIHISDVCRLLLLAAHVGRRLPAKQECEPGRGVYFAASPETVNYEEFGRMIAAALGRPGVIVIHNRPWSGFAVAGVAEMFARLRGRAAILSVDKMRDAFAGDWHCSGEQAARELDFKPGATLAERLAETVAWYRANGWLPARPGMVIRKHRPSYVAEARRVPSSS